MNERHDMYTDDLKEYPGSNQYWLYTSMQENNQKAAQLLESKNRVMNETVKNLGSLSS